MSPGTPPDVRARMRVVFSEDGRDFSQRDWSELVAADPDGTVFHTPRFLKLYWEEFAATPRDLLLAFAEAGDGRQLGAAAFERAGSTLRFLGGTEVTDYQGPVALPDAADDVADELIAALATREDWTDADLGGLPEDSAWLGRLTRAAEARGLPVTELEDQNGVAPFVVLPGSGEAYLRELPSKLRHEIRRKARRLEAEAAGYELVAATPATMGEDLDRFVELHRASEGPKAGFLQPGMEIFFRRLAEAFLPDGVFHLVFLQAGAERLAATIGFRLGGTYSLYNSAFDRSWGALSPGMVLVAELIRDAADAGCRTFDLLKGDYRYKYRFGARPRRIRRLMIERP